MNEVKWKYERIMLIAHLSEEIDQCDLFAHLNEKKEGICPNALFPTACRIPIF